MKMWRTSIKRMAIAVAIAAVAFTGAATTAVAAQPAPAVTTPSALPTLNGPSSGTLFGCRSGWACLYTDRTDVLSASHPHTDYFFYGFDNFSNVTGMHWLFNNQTGGARVYLCLGFNGTNCPPFTVNGVSHPYVQAGFVLNYNMTPINSIRLCPASGC